jgi:hypothetical protein
MSRRCLIQLLPVAQLFIAKSSFTAATLRLECRAMGGRVPMPPETPAIFSWNCLVEMARSIFSSAG